MNYLKYQRGMSLVEVLVATVISLFLLGGIIQVYLANKSSYSFTTSSSRIQENGRYAMDTLAVDLRMAGFFGCAIFDPDDTSTIVNNLNPAGAGYNEIYDFIGDGILEATENDGVNGSDSITIRGAKPGALNIYPPYGPSTSAQIFVGNTDILEVGDIVLVTNCKGADIFQITNTTQGSGSAKDSVVHNTGTGTVPGNYNPDTCKSGHCLSQVYGADASMIELQVVTYSIQDGESGEPALFRSVNGIDQELIDGIEQMQILYGIDTTDDDHPNRYVISTDVPKYGSMNDVMAVRLMLLVRSNTEFVVEAPQALNYNGATSTAADYRLRQVFTSTITLRNRIGGT